MARCAARHNSPRTLASGPVLVVVLFFAISIDLQYITGLGQKLGTCSGYEGRLTSQVPISWGFPSISCIIVIYRISCVVSEKGKLRG